MQLFADVLDVNGVRAGKGPLIRIRSARVQRMLDGAGSISISVPSTDSRTAEIQHKRRLVLYGYQFGAMRELGRGIVDVIERNSTATERALSVSGPDILGELKYSNTLLGRKLESLSINQAASTLMDITQE